MRPLGNRQRAVLKSLERESYPGGWYYASHDVTREVLDSLVKRGLVDYRPGEGRVRPFPRWTINDAGRDALRPAYAPVGDPRGRDRGGMLT